MRAVPPMRKENEITPVIPCTIEGSTAIVPKNKAPTTSNRFKIKESTCTVASPGRTPGMNPPDF